MSNNAWSGIVVFVFMFGGLVWISYIAKISQLDETTLIDRWAKANGYQILHSELRYFRRGPLLWTSSKLQWVYYVRIRNQDGHERSGWVRFGGFLVGLMSNKTEVRWEDKP